MDVARKVDRPDCPLHERILTLQRRALNGVFHMTILCAWWTWSNAPEDRFR
ncbi:hypothetical protein HRbin17_00472 [bacterium HR17]|uniref:Uncharacterized protein n=1 Tax=Candidatus Fervidibacter japonicus TaxID=2035412 RepID=A0A2H5XA44_9BACT|nr:hypothetical protein HRbin17_00472 [bacterium HR17]